MTNTQDQVGDAQQATAEAEAIARINSSGNGHKVVYIVRVQDAENEGKIRSFATLKKDNCLPYLEIVGIELLNNKTRKTQKIDKSEVIEKVKSETGPVINICFPWHTVIDIQNLTYQHKQKR